MAPHTSPLRRFRRRYILPGHWVHVSARTGMGRYAFEQLPPPYKARAWGIVGRASRRYGVGLAAFVLMSNHFHAMIQARQPRRVSQWCQYVMAGLARLTHELHGTSGPVWDGPFRHTNLLTPEAEVACFRYILAHGLKEGLVAHPGAWPGPNCVDALLFGEPIVGTWLDKEAWRLARRKRAGVSQSRYLHPVPVELTPLSIGHRSPEVWRRVCEEIITSLLIEHARPGLPTHHVTTRDHTYIPKTVKKSRAWCFDARSAAGEVDTTLLREAEAARRAAVGVSVEGYRRLVAPALDAPPHGLQWPALIAQAGGHPAAEAPFIERPPDPVGRAASAFGRVCVSTGA